MGLLAEDAETQIDQVIVIFFVSRTVHPKKLPDPSRRLGDSFPQPKPALGHRLLAALLEDSMGPGGGQISD